MFFVPDKSLKTDMDFIGTFISKETKNIIKKRIDNVIKDIQK